MSATMEIKYTVTRYQPSYDADVTKLCQAFSDESLKEYGLEVHQDRLDQMTELCKDVAFFLVVNGQVVGLIAGMVQENLTNGKTALQEVIWYVYPEHRSNGKALMDMFEEAAKNLGCSCVVMALMCNSMADRLRVFYERMGYRPFEIQFMKEIQ